MRVQITPTKVVRGNVSDSASSARSFAPSGDMWLDLADAEVYVSGSVLAIRDKQTGDIYITDEPVASGTTKLAAAANTGGWQVLT